MTRICNGRAGSPTKHFPVADGRLIVQKKALFSTAARAIVPPINTLKNSLFGGRTDTAINGYDPVAYFTVGKPVKGQDALTTEWSGANPID